MRDLDELFDALARSPFRRRFAERWQQTPFRGHPVFIAQHATATCCRGCLAKWHGIERGKELTPSQQARIVATIGRWLDTQAAPE